MARRLCNNVRLGEYELMPSAMTGAFFSGNRMFRHGVWDDGSCFFHSIASALNYKGYNQLSPDKRRVAGRRLRCGVWKHLNQLAWAKVWARRGIDPGAVHRELADMKTMFADHKTWADVHMILYVMDKLNINVIFFDLENESIYCGVRGYDAGRQQTVLIAWVGHTHFEPLCRLDPSTQAYQSLFSSKDPMVHMHI